MTFNPRTTPARPDLAARHLEGLVQAGRFVDGTVQEVIDPLAAVRRAPAPDAPLDTEALMGERVTVYEATDEGWAWGQIETDGYVGWLPASALGQPGPEPTHKVAALRTLMFPGPSIELPPTMALPLGARLAIVGREGRLAVTAGGGYVPAHHLAPMGDIEHDFVAVAERFIGTPYLWGGKTSQGLDCSGLVQVALAACGILSPRDSDMQQRELWHPFVPDAEYTNFRRGDLVFWKGHVGIVRDPATFLHATAFHMAVTVEPLTDVLARIRASDSEPTGVKRL